MIISTLCWCVRMQMSAAVRNPRINMITHLVEFESTQNVQWTIVTKTGNWNSLSLATVCGKIPVAPTSWGSCDDRCNRVCDSNNHGMSSKC